MKISTEVIADALEKRILPNEKTILYVGIKYDYGHADWGLSYEHHNFYRTFLDMGYSMIYFDYMSIMQEFGTDGMSRILAEAVYYYNPDVLFYFHFHDWIDKQILAELPVKKYIWNADDSWRYDAEKPVWKLFDTIITTDTPSHEKRLAAGYNSVLSEWACNHNLCRDLGMERIYDVSFIGSKHSNREEFVNKLRENGINIKCFGKGWSDTERISQAGLIEIYNQSKIVLNISSDSAGKKIQVNARDFEATGCGALLLTQDSPAIRECFDNEKEIVTYNTPVGAIEKIKVLLNQPDKLKAIAQAGHARTLKDHTYVKRFYDIKGLA